MKIKKVSLLIVTPSFKGGGAEKVAVNLANQYASNGVKVTLLAVSPEGPYRELVKSCVKVVDVNGKSLAFSLFGVFKAIRAIKPTHVLSVIRETNIFVGLSRWFLALERVVFREANTLDHIYASPCYKRWLWYVLLRVSYANSDWVIANSKGTEEHLLKSKLVKSSKVKVIDNPVLPSEVDELLSEGVSNDWLMDPNLQVVLSVGRLHKQKNQALLVKAFADVEKKISNARLIILGEGGEEARLRQLAKEEGIEKKFQIISFQKNPYPYYKHADVFVLSSNYEGFGNVVVEALSSGNPVICTNCPGGPKGILADGEFGILTEPDSRNELANAVIDILERRIIFEPAELIKRSQEYSVKAASAKYWSLLEE